MGEKTYFWPLNDKSAREGFDRLWVDMSALNQVRETQIMVNARLLRFEKTAGPLLRTDFKTLCGENNGPADYLAIAERFTTVFIEDVPQLGPENRNEAKRFVTLIDALYEASVLLVILSETKASLLYPNGDGRFEFARTLSRLEEMGSIDYMTRSR
jgi:cell division protein ZapE